jgi:hypothetical protein
VTAKQNRDRCKPIAAEVGWERLAAIAADTLPDEPFSPAAFRLAVKRALRIAGVAATTGDAINTIATGEGKHWTHANGMWRKT